MRIILLFTVIVLIKFLLNLYNYIRIRTLNKYFDEFIHQKRKNMNIYRQEVLDLFKKAGIKDIKIPVTEPHGFNQIINANVSVFSMFPSLRPVFAATSQNMFEEAEGVFRKNMINCINPLYWIELVIFLPKNIFQYLEITSETVAFKFLNLILSFIWWSICALVTFFSPEINKLIIKLLTNF